MPRIFDSMPAQVALTNGVDEAIHVLFEAFLETGDELLLPVPTYTMYEVYASATDARVVTVQAGDDLQFPFERLLAAITARTKVIAIANPNSPSGSVATREQLLELRAVRRTPCCWSTRRTFTFYGETVMDLVGNSAEPVGRAHIFEGVWAGWIAARLCLPGQSN